MGSSRKRHGIRRARKHLWRRAALGGNILLTGVTRGLLGRIITYGVATIRATVLRDGVAVEDGFYARMVSARRAAERWLDRHAPPQRTKRRRR
jgi:hypothetical protein